MLASKAGRSPQSLGSKTGRVFIFGVAIVKKGEWGVGWMERRINGVESFTRQRYSHGQDLLLENPTPYSPFPTPLPSPLPRFRLKVLVVEQGNAVAGLGHDEEALAIGVAVRSGFDADAGHGAVELHAGVFGEEGGEAF